MSKSSETAATTEPRTHYLSAPLLASDQIMASLHRDLLHVSRVEAPPLVRHHWPRSLLHAGLPLHTSDSEVLVVSSSTPAGCPVQASQSSGPRQSVGQRGSQELASLRLCARLVHSCVCVSRASIRRSQHPCVALHLASLTSALSAAHGLCPLCSSAPPTPPVVTVVQRFAGAGKCISASLCSSCPLRRVCVALETA
jgi:hypothetical protein